MSLKTCKILQIISTSLFALALALVLLSIPFKNTLIRLAYPDYLAVGDASAFAHSVFPTINALAAAFYLGISAIHLTTLKIADKRRMLVSAVACCALLLVYRIASPYLNDYFSSRALARSEGSYSGYYSAYAMVENALHSVLPFMVVPGSILMLLSVGGSIGKGVEQKNAAGEADASETAASAEGPALTSGESLKTGGAAAQEPSAPAAEPAPVDTEKYHSAFMRPRTGAEPSDGSPAGTAADLEAYHEAFKRPREDK